MPVSLPGGNGCKNDEFWDPRNGGECWSCPPGFTRAGSIAPVNRQGACVAEKRCKNDLVEVNGRCQTDPRPSSCGREGQQACKLWEFVPSCADDLMESPKQGGRCIKPPPGVDPFWGTFMEAAEIAASVADRQQCQRDVLKSTAAADAFAPRTLTDLMAPPGSKSSATCTREVAAGFACEVPYMLDIFFGLGQLAADSDKVLIAIQQEYEKYAQSKTCKDAVRQVDSDQAKAVEVSCALGLMLVGQTIDDLQCSFGLLGDPGVSLRSGASNTNLCIAAGQVGYLVAESQLQEKIGGMLSRPLEKKFEQVVKKRRDKRAQTEEDRLIADFGADQPLSPNEVALIQDYVGNKAAQQEASFIKRFKMLKTVMNKVGLVLTLSPELIHRAASVPACHINLLGTASYSPLKKNSIPKVFQLKVQASGKCLNMGGVGSNGSIQTQWDCDAGNNQQHYEAIDTGAGYYNIRNLASQRCLGIDGARTSDGNRAINIDCKRNRSDQRWKLETYDEQSIRLVAKHSNKCLDLSKGSQNDGGEFNQWQCVNGHANQHFQMQPIADVIVQAANPQPNRPISPSRIPQAFSLKVKATGKCLDMGGVGDDGSVQHQWNCDTTNQNQVYQAIPKGEGYYHIVSEASGKCLGVSGAAMGDGAGVVNWRCNDNAPDHAWRIEENGGGQYRLVNRNSGRCLDLTGGNTRNGTPFEQWNCADKHPNQSFDLLVADLIPPKFILQVEKSGACVDMGGDGANGSQQHQWGCDRNNRNQVYEALSGRDKNHFAIRNLASGRCMGIDGGNSRSGTAIINWDCMPGEDVHNWEFVNLTGGYYMLKSKLTGKCVDVANGAGRNGDKLTLQTCKRGNQVQTFILKSTN